MLYGFFESDRVYRHNLDAHQVFTYRTNMKEAILKYIDSRITSPNLDDADVELTTLYNLIEDDHFDA